MAVAYTWTGSGGDGLGNNPNNWSPYGVPAFGDTANIASSVTIDASNGPDVSTFAVSAPNVDLKNVNSGTIKLTAANLMLDNFKSYATIGANALTLNDASNALIDTTSGTITVTDTTGKSGVAINANGDPFTLTTNGTSVSVGGVSLASGSFVTLNAADPGGSFISIDNESVMEARQALAASVRVIAGGRLILDRPNQYTGLLYFNGGRVDLPASTTATSFTYDKANYTLTLTDVTGTAVASIKFLAETSFQINKDATGTYITKGYTAIPTIGSVGSAVVKNYTITDTTTGVVTQQDGSHYVGPVSGIWNQYASTTPDSVNITANVPSTFIRGGPGNDSIDVSKVAGNNVLDGSSGSNFLTGSLGLDTFYIDDRNQTATTWSSIVNFHTGDNATVFGVNISDFTLTWLDHQGAAGFTGLTGVFSNKATGALAAVTIAGYSQADLANGILTVGYNKTPDIPGLPGSQYMTIHGV